MESQSEGNEEMANMKEMRQKLESRIGSLHNAQLDLIAALQTQVPDIVSSLDLSLKVISSFNGRPYSPLPAPLPNPNAYPNKCKPEINTDSPENTSIRTSSESKATNSKNHQPKQSPEVSNFGGDIEKFTMDESGSPLSVVRSMVAVSLLERVPFTPIDSSTVLMKLENDQSATSAEKAALRELGGESGAILAVEMALRSMAEDDGGVDLEEFVVSGKSRVMVVEIDRSRLVKELPESKQLHQNESNPSGGNQIQQVGAMGGGDFNSGMFGMGSLMPRSVPDMWMGPGDPHFSGMPPIFPGNGGPGPMMGQRGGPRGMVGMMGMPRGMMGVPPMHRPPTGLNAQTGGSNAISMKPRTEEDDLKDLEALLNKKSFKELQKSKTGEELLDLIHRPTAKETAVAAKVFLFPSFIMYL